MSQRNLMLLMCFVCASLQAEMPKAIATGWDLSCLPASQIGEQAEYLIKSGFDGLSFRLCRPELDRIELEDGTKTSDCCPCNGGRWSRTEMARRLISPIRTAVEKAGLEEGFLSFLYAPRNRLDWRDDKAWADFAANMRTAAYIAKTSGLRGFILDTEDYMRQSQYRLIASDDCFEHVARIARKRGAEVFRGVFEEFPDITILTFWWLSFIREYGASYDLVADMRSFGDLLPAFTDGILDVMPNTVKFVDGNEFTYMGGIGQNYVSQTHEYAELVSPENRGKYRCCFRASCGIYLDMFTNPEFKADGTRHPYYARPASGSRLNALIDRIEEAFQYSDDYVWIFGEKHAYADWQDVQVPPRWEDPFTNGTWEVSLPGFSEQLRILKNPQKELLPRLSALKNSSEALNVVSEPDRRDPYSVRAKVEDVRHGEWYAFLVELKSDHPWVWVHPTINGKRDWSQRQDHIILSAPDGAGVRRGVGFARVRERTTGFDIECSYNHNVRTKVEVLSLSAYRVYAP